ncbi:hypothetical protein Tco_0321489 [Tanacetum coccineum]
MDFPNLDDISEDFQSEFESLPFVYLKSVESVMLVNRIPELMHVDFWNIYSDEKCRVTWSESQSIQNNLKCRLSLNLSRIESSISFSNVKSFLLWNKFKIKFCLLSSDGRHDSAKSYHIQFIYKQICITEGQCKTDLHKELCTQILGKL